MILAAGFGLVIGVTLGLLGAGGSILAVPALVYGMGEPVRQAIPASLVMVGLSAMGGVVPRLRQGIVRWPIAGVFGAAGAGATFGGAAVGRLVSAQVLLLAFAVVMVAAAARMLLGPTEPRGACTVSGGRVNWRSCLPRALGVGAAVGFLTGLFGVGGGFLVVPALVLMLGLDMPAAVATSLLIVTINSVAGLAAHWDAVAELDYSVVAAFTIAALAASVASGRLAGRVDADSLRRWFAYLVIAVAVFVAVQALLNPSALT
ncbi:sulfite exporter TauE/SafE family protein [Amycolatopsis sp. NPDC057786]|uniref:sulfite exporter TauE/SafE family protein n=1 Tax=Amycolatopsis sp. NPDC057786 TaxID=3346250 RepID=UPI00366AACC4